jgi:molybdopterin synthase sulfur carrier subunit
MEEAKSSAQMKVNILAFGVTKEIFGGASIEMDLENETTVAELKNRIEAAYPEMKDLSSCMIAVNDEYAKDDMIIHPEDEIAVIPPVSGG